MEIVTFRITGVSPVLMHSPGSMGGGAKDGLTTGKKTYDPVKEAEGFTYRNERGELIVPGMAFRAALFVAGTHRKIGKVSANTAISSAIFPVESECLLLDPSTKKPVKKYEIHKCRVVVNRAGVIRSRPMIRHWMLDLALEIDTDMIPEVTVVEELLNVAGKVAGVLDWRPAKRGTFGRFTAAIRN